MNIYFLLWTTGIVIVIFLLLQKKLKKVHKDNNQQSVVKESVTCCSELNEFMAKSVILNLVFLEPRYYRCLAVGIASSLVHSQVDHILWVFQCTVRIVDDECHLKHVRPVLPKRC